MPRHHGHLVTSLLNNNNIMTASHCTNDHVHFLPVPSTPRCVDAPRTIWLRCLDDCFTVSLLPKRHLFGVWRPDDSFTTFMPNQQFSVCINHKLYDAGSYSDGFISRRHKWPRSSIPAALGGMADLGRLCHWEMRLSESQKSGFRQQQGCKTLCNCCRGAVWYREGITVCGTR